MVGHREGQPGDDDIGERFARDIDPLPETVGAEEHRIDVGLEFLQHQRARCAGPLHETHNAQLVKELLHALANVLHQFEIREEHEGLPVGHLHEMLDPANQSIAITGVARVGHLVHDKDFHLALVIEG